MLPLLRSTSTLVAAALVLTYAFTAVASTTLPSVLVHYEVRRPRAAAGRFELLRTPSRIEHRFVDRGMTEVWQRDARGELEHWKVFHRDGKAVHYNAGDLRTLHVWPSWEHLGTLIDPTDRTQLTATPKRRKMGGELAVELRGSSSAPIARVLWLEALSVPAELALGRRGENAILRLAALEKCEQACAPVSMEGFSEIEFADVGDMERDPFVRRFLALTGHGHDH
jgi:hypothetical protein